MADALGQWVMDKRYHSIEVVVAMESVGKRSYIAEAERGRRLMAPGLIGAPACNAQGQAQVMVTA